METNINNKYLYGCSHYKRGCKIYAKCCKKWYNCNLCHDEQQSHQIDIESIKRIKCSYCCKIQSPKQYCNNLNCQKCLGEYYCSKCIIYSNKHIHKKIFHCDKCHICLYGNKSKFKHCDICDYCYKKNTTHICIENKIKNNCGICMNNMYKSQKELTILNCGHAIHTKCINNYIENIIYKSKKKKLFCPICRYIIINLNDYTDYNSDSEMNIYCTNRYNYLLRPLNIRSNYIQLESDNEDDIINNYSNIDIIEQEIISARQELETRIMITNILDNNILNMSSTI